MKLAIFYTPRKVFYEFIEYRRETPYLRSLQSCRIDNVFIPQAERVMLRKPCLGLLDEYTTH